MESGSGRKQRSDARNNRARLIEAAQEVWAEQPQASMRSIAAAAGLGRNTIHRHFPGRRDLLDAVRLKIASDNVASDEDDLRPAGTLRSPVPARLLVADVLNKVPPFRLAEQLIAEVQRLSGVTSAAIYVADLDGLQLRRLAGADPFPDALTVDIGVGPEIPREGLSELGAWLEAQLPGVSAAPMMLRGRATGVILTLGAAPEHELLELAGVAAVSLELADRYTDQGERASRARATTAAAEIQQSMLPPRIVRVAGATIAGNVTPGYEIGGDWFDYADNPEGTWLAITDTHGTGPRTTAVAALLLGAFRSARHLPGATPPAVIRAMHQTLTGLGPLAVPVSATVAIWNATTNTVLWTTTGPTRPILLRAGEPAQMIGESHPPLGTGELPPRLRIQRRHLHEGDRLLFASDGLLSHPNQELRPFGTLGVTGALAELGTDSPPAASTIVRAIEHAARNQTASSFEDDATLMVLAPTITPRDHDSVNL